MNGNVPHTKRQPSTSQQEHKPKQRSRYDTIRYDTNTFTSPLHNNNKCLLLSTYSTFKIGKPTANLFRSCCNERTNERTLTAARLQVDIYIYIYIHIYLHIYLHILMTPQEAVDNADSANSLVPLVKSDLPSFDVSGAYNKRRIWMDGWMDGSGE